MHNNKKVRLLQKKNVTSITQNLVGPNSTWPGAAGPPQFQLVQGLVGQQCAVSPLIPIVSPQYSFDNMPILRNNTSLSLYEGVEVTFEVIRKLNAVNVRVKSTKTDETDHALLPSTADNDHLRNAAIECTDSLFKRMQSVEGEPVHDVSKCSLPYLLEHHVIHLERPHKNFKWAVYYCKLCDYHMKSINHVRDHLLMPHFNEEQHISERKLLFQSLKPLEDCHITAMNAEIDRILLMRTKSLCEHFELITSRVLQLLKDIVENEMKKEGYSFCLFGSTVVKTYSADSDINICVESPTTDVFEINECGEELKQHLIDHLKRIEENAEVKWDSRTLSLAFVYERIKIDVRFDTATNVGLARYLQVLTLVRCQLVPFLRFIRYWAKTSGMCEGNKNGRFGMKLFAFDILAVHYLQQKGFLPALHEMKMKNPSATELCLYRADCYENDSKKIISAFGKDERIWCLAQLCNGFLEYYLKEMSTICVQICTTTKILRMDTKWNKKHFIIYDPFRRENIGNNLTSSNQIFIMNTFLWSFCYLNVPNFLRTEQNNPAFVELYQKISETPIKTKSTKKKPKTPRSSDSDTSKHFLQIESNEVGNSCQKKLFHCFEKTEVNQGDVELLEDPIDVSEFEEELTSNFENLMHDGRLIREMKDDDFQVDDHLNAQYGRRSIHRLRRVNAIGISNVVWDLLVHNNLNVVFRDFGIYNNENTGKAGMERIQNKERKDLSMSSKSTDELGCAELESQYVESTTLTSQNIPLMTHTNFEEMPLPQEKISYEMFHIKVTLDPMCPRTRDCVFHFEDANNFTGGYQPDRRCTSCYSQEHEKNDCPELKVPEYTKKDRKMTEEEVRLISQWINEVFDDNVLKPEHESFVNEVLDHLQCSFSRIFHREVRLSVFGSYRNQFGVIDSDVDVCFQFDSDEKPEDTMLTAEYVIGTIDRKMRRMNQFVRVESITNAKVPIVKFEIRNTKKKHLEGDISYYNCLALHNTELLKTYCEWWPPLRKLGIFIKKWAKEAHIGDASKGSLSSYAYTLLLIHYLQHCESPVLPVLQDEPFVSADTPAHFVEGHEVKFCKDVSMREKLNWPESKKTLAEHFVDFLDYYCRFEFDSTVIQIRRKRPLSVIEKQRESEKFEKHQQWLNKMIYIEDPFDLTHNLPCGISERMFVYVTRTFHEARNAFMDGYIVDLCRSKINNEIDLKMMKRLFVEEYKMQEEPPKVCKLCHKQGHFTENCLNKYRAPTRLAGDRSRGSFRGGRGRDRHGAQYSPGFPLNGAQFTSQTNRIQPLLSDYGFLRSQILEEDKRPQKQHKSGAKKSTSRGTDRRRGRNRVNLISGDN